MCPVWRDQINFDKSTYEDSTKENIEPNITLTTQGSVFNEAVILKLGTDKDIEENWSKFVDLNVETSKERAILGQLALNSKGQIIDLDHRVYPKHISRNCVADVTLMVYGNPWDRFSILALCDNDSNLMMSANPADIAEFFKNLPKLSSIHLLSCESRDFGLALSMLLPNVEITCYEHRITVKKPNLILQNIECNGVLRNAGETDAHVFVSDRLGYPPKGIIDRADGLKEAYEIPQGILTDIQTNAWFMSYISKHRITHKSKPNIQKKF